MEPAHLPDSDKTILNRPEWDETIQDCDRIQHCDKIQNTNLFMRHGVLKYTRWNTGLDTCYTVCHVFCEIHFNMKTVELHYIDILNSHKRWSDSLWLTYKYTGGVKQTVHSSPASYPPVHILRLVRHPEKFQRHLFLEMFFWNGKIIQ